MEMFATLANLATALAAFVGIPVAVLTYAAQKRKDRRLREMETYLQAKREYVEYLTLCLQNPDLGGYDLSLLEPHVSASGMDIRKLTMFTILTAMLEAGFILYADQRQEGRARQWAGWQQYLRMWASRPDFRKAWPVVGPQFDSVFVQEMGRLIDETPPLAPASGG